MHEILTYLSSQYEEVYIGGISTGATLALCTAAHAPVPVSGVLALCGTVGAVSTGTDVEAVSMIDGPGLSKLSPAAEKMVSKAVPQRPHLVYTENCAIDTVHPFRLAAAAMWQMKAHLNPKVFKMSLIPHGFVPMGPNGHDPGPVELFMISDFFEATHKARLRKNRRFEMLPIPPAPSPKKSRSPMTPMTPSPKKAKARSTSDQKAARKHGKAFSPKHHIRKLSFA
jgi:pimeloyl-ACP methyl ester carboxylesterase